MSKASAASDELVVKITIIGDITVGKTTLINKYCNYNGNPVEIQRKHVVFQKRKLQLVFPDSLGAEQFGTVTSFVYQNTALCLLVYDVTNPESFDNIANWDSEIGRYAPKRGAIPKALCGNKCELPEKVDEAKVAAVLESKPMPQFKTSALSGQGVEEMFNELLPLAIEEAIKQLKERNKPVPGGDLAPKKGDKKKGGCVLL